MCSPIDGAPLTEPLAMAVARSWRPASQARAHAAGQHRPGSPGGSHPLASPPCSPSSDLRPGSPAPLSSGGPLGGPALSCTRPFQATCRRLKVVGGPSDAASAANMAQQPPPMGRAARPSLPISPCAPGATRRSAPRRMSAAAERAIPSAVSRRVAKAGVQPWTAGPNLS